jgi:hypothetical protein
VPTIQPRLIFDPLNARGQADRKDYTSAADPIGPLTIIGQAITPRIRAMPITTQMMAVGRTDQLDNS